MGRSRREDVRLQGSGVALSGSRAMTITTALTIVLTARSASGTVTQLLHVLPPTTYAAMHPQTLRLPVIRYFTLKTDPRTHQRMLTWSVDGATSMALNNAPVTRAATRIVPPLAPGDTDYTLSATNALGTVTESMMATLIDMPVIAHFTLVHQNPGQPYRLVWLTRNARRVTLNGTAVTLSGSVVLSPPLHSAIYALIAVGQNSRATAQIHLVVRGAQPLPVQLFVIAAPQIMALALRRTSHKTYVVWRVRDALKVTLQGRQVSSEGQLLAPGNARVLRLLASNDAGIQERSLRMLRLAPTATPTLTPTPTATATPVPTDTPSATATPTFSPSPTPRPVATPTWIPSATTAPIPSATTTLVPSATATLVPSATATSIPSATTTPIPLPTATALPAPSATPAPTPTCKPLATGVTHVDPAASDPRFGIDEAYLKPDAANALGVRWSRIPFSWNIIQQNGPTDWNRFALSSHGTDSVINAELARGRSVTGLLLATPGWAAVNPAWGTASVPKNLNLPWNSPDNYWGVFVEKMAREFAGRIDYWTIWNEVDIPAGTGWQQWHPSNAASSAAEYARLLEVAYQAIHAGNPAAKIIIYGDPYWYDHGAYLTNLYNILARDDPAGRYHGFFDVANLHLYSNPTDFYPIIEQVQALLKVHGWSNKPLWISETNAEPYDDPAFPAQPTNFRVSMQAQAAFLVDAFASYIAAGADRIEVYRMFDRPGESGRWGLINSAGWPRPCTCTYRFLTQLFKGARGGTYTPGNKLGHKSGVFTVVVNKPGARITVLWNQDGADTTYTLPAHASHATRYDKFGNARPVTPSGGVYTFALPGGRDFTNIYDSRIPTVGGDPIILVEPAP